jgi:hypothetical protein
MDADTVTGNWDVICGGRYCGTTVDRVDHHSADNIRPR